MASEPEHRCVSENLGRLNDQSHRFPIRRLLSYRTTRHHASPPREYISIRDLLLLSTFVKNSICLEQVISLSRSRNGCFEGAIVSYRFVQIFEFFFPIDRIKIVSTKRRSIERKSRGLEATENYISVRRRETIVHCCNKRLQIRSLVRNDFFERQFNWLVVAYSKLARCKIVRYSSHHRSSCFHARTCPTAYIRWRERMSRGSVTHSSIGAEKRREGNDRHAGVRGV